MTSQSTKGEGSSAEKRFKLLTIMKLNIHPQYYPEAKAHCACGNNFTVGSTKPEFKLEICNACHPVYTGKKKLLDIAGRVEKFKARQNRKIAKPKIKKERAKKGKKNTNDKK